MQTIREDLVGVVFVATENGSPIMLKAGDEVPEGVTVGDHLTVDEPTTDTDGKPEPKPKTRR